MRGQSLFILFICSLILSGCQSSGQPEETAEEQTGETSPEVHNQLTQEEKAAGWELLFDGETMDKWRVYKKDTLMGWKIEGDAMIAMGEKGPDGHANDIITKEEFEDFELSLEWKVSAEGNSGIFFNVVESDEYGSVSDTGPEYQIVDFKGWPEPLESWQAPGANYAMHPPAKMVEKPVGEYNHSRIMVKDGHVQHWLNGEKIVEYDLWTPEWEALVKDGKWKDYPGYGKAKSGHIALQDHGNQIWFRNIKIRRL